MMAPVTDALQIWQVSPSAPNQQKQLKPTLSTNRTYLAPLTGEYAQQEDALGPLRIMRLRLYHPRPYQGHKTLRKPSNQPTTTIESDSYPPARQNITQYYPDHLPIWSGAFISSSNPLMPEQVLGFTSVLSHTHGTPPGFWNRVDWRALV